MRTKRFLRIKAVTEKVGFSKATVYRRMKTNTFPKSIHLSSHCVAWDEETLNRWMDFAAENGGQNAIR